MLKNAPEFEQQRIMCGYSGPNFHSDHAKLMASEVRKGFIVIKSACLILIFMTCILHRSGLWWEKLQFSRLLIKSQWP